MSQSLSQPARWTAAVDSATKALWRLKDLRDQLITAYEEVEDEWTDAREKFDAALSALIDLQSDYACWTVPDSFRDSKTQEKLDWVAGLKFQELIGTIPDLETILDPLERFDPWEYDDYAVLREAQTTSWLPRGYGRD